MDGLPFPCTPSDRGEEEGAPNRDGTKQRGEHWGLGSLGNPHRGWLSATPRTVPLGLPHPGDRSLERVHVLPFKKISNSRNIVLLTLRMASLLMSSLIAPFI